MNLWTWCHVRGWEKYFWVSFCLIKGVTTWNQLKRQCAFFRVMFWKHAFGIIAITELLESAWWLGYGMDGQWVGIESLHGKKFISTPHSVQPSCGPHSASYATGTGEQSDRAMKLMTHLDLMLEVRMRGDISPLFRTSVWRGDQAQVSRNGMQKWFSSWNPLPTKYMSVLLGQCTGVWTVQVACSTLITVCVIKRLPFAHVVYVLSLSHNKERLLSTLHKPADVYCKVRTELLDKFHEFDTSVG
jgi:hypothetical protein